MPDDNTTPRRAPRKRRASKRDFGSVVSTGTPTAPSFTVRWVEGGRRRGRRGFRTKTEAQAFLAKVRVAAESGLLDAHRAGETTLADVGREWLRTHSKPKLRSHEDNVQRWGLVVQHFGERLAVNELTHGRIVDFREWLSKGRAAPTVNRVLALLRSVLNFAVSAGYLQTSPIARFRRGSYMLAERPAKLRPPLETPHEAAKLLAYLRQTAPGWYPIAGFLMLTGARRGEAAGLQWGDVDPSRRVVTIRRSFDALPKSGKGRVVPMTSELATILEEHLATSRKTKPGDLVFPHPDTGKPLPRDAWHLNTLLERACEALGLQRMTVHDLRHGFASLWVMAGGSLLDLQKTLGHSSANLTASVYAHLATEHLVTEANRRMTLGLERAHLASVEDAGTVHKRHRSDTPSSESDPAKTLRQGELSKNSG
ncbi:MAG: site-specific integrase [Myxococcales bacterium]|nr:site-specific integrase [Myxococcales bacterium]